MWKGEGGKNRISCNLQKYIDYSKERFECWFKRKKKKEEKKSLNRGKKEERQGSPRIAFLRRKKDVESPVGERKKKAEQQQMREKREERCPALIRLKESSSIRRSRDKFAESSQKKKSS